MPVPFFETPVDTVVVFPHFGQVIVKLVAINFSLILGMVEINCHVRKNPVYSPTRLPIFLVNLTNLSGGKPDIAFVNSETTSPDS